MTEKTKTVLYWVLSIIGIVMAFTAMFIHFDHHYNDWCRLAMTTGFSITLLGMLIKPITRKELESGTAGNIFFVAVMWAIITFIWILKTSRFQSSSSPLLTSSRWSCSAGWHSRKSNKPKCSKRNWRTRKKRAERPTLIKKSYLCKSVCNQTDVQEV